VSGGELSAEERRILLRVARGAIEARLTSGRQPPRPAAGPVLERPQGAFVTLTRRVDGDLRGCIGLLEPQQPLVDTVARAAVAAATEDERFDPVTRDELGGIAVEISVLGPLAPVKPEDVEVGRHGLLIRSGVRQGLLLPQVATEHGWDLVTFLGRTCVKAGLPEDAWRKPGVEIRAFTAEVFGEEE